MADITLPSGEKDTTGDNNHLQDTPESSTKAELSPTREVLALFFSHLERFQFREAARILSLGAVRHTQSQQFLVKLRIFS